MSAATTSRLAKAIPAPAAVAALVAMLVVRGAGAQDTILLVHGASAEEVPAIGEAIRQADGIGQGVEFREIAPVAWYLPSEFPVWVSNAESVFCPAWENHWALEATFENGKDALARGDSATAIKVLAPVVKSLQCLDDSLVASDQETLGMATFVLGLALHRAGKTEQAAGIFQQAASYWPTEEQSTVTDKLEFTKLYHDEGLAVGEALSVMGRVSLARISPDPGFSCFLDGMEIDAATDVRPGLHVLRCRGFDGNAAIRVVPGQVELLPTEDALRRLADGDPGLTQLARGIHDSAVGEGFTSVLLLDMGTGNVVRVDGVSGTVERTGQFEPDLLRNRGAVGIAVNDGGGEDGEEGSVGGEAGSGGGGGAEPAGVGTGPTAEPVGTSASKGKTAGAVMTIVGGVTAAGGLVVGLQQRQTALGIYDEAQKDMVRRDGWFCDQHALFDEAELNMEIGYGIAIAGGVVTAVGLTALIISSLRSPGSSEKPLVSMSFGVQMDHGQVHGAMFTLYTISR